MSAFGGRGPFDDPFFTDPFGGMDRMMNRMNTMMGSMFSDPFFSDPFFNPPRGMPQLEGSGVQQHRRLPGPTITEVHADDEQQGNVEGDDAPIVEEPEDVGAVRRREAAAPERGVRHMPMPEHNWMPEVRHGASGGTQMWSFSSSTFHSSGGPGGHTYTKSMSARTGPGDLSEMRAFEKDSRSGQQREAQRRGIGSRQRTMTRTRNAAGQEDQRDILQGMNSAEEVSRFEEDWIGRTHSLQEPVRRRGRLPTSGWDGGMQSAALPSAPHRAFNGGAPPLMQAPYERYNSRYGQR